MEYRITLVWFKKIWQRVPNEMDVLRQRKYSIKFEYLSCNSFIKD